MEFRIAHSKTESLIEYQILSEIENEAEAILILNSIAFTLISWMQCGLTQCMPNIKISAPSPSTWCWTSWFRMVWQTVVWNIIISALFFVHIFSWNWTCSSVSECGHSKKEKQKEKKLKKMPNKTIITLSPSVSTTYANAHRISWNKAFGSTYFHTTRGCGENKIGHEKLREIWRNDIHSPTRRFCFLYGFFRSSLFDDCVEWLVYNISRAESKHPKKR